MTTTHTDTNAAAALLPLPVSALVIATSNLLEAGSDLPQPRYLRVSGSQSIDLGFGGDPSSYQAITRWALRFGVTAQTSPHTTSEGELKTYVLAAFDYHGIAVEAYAFVPPGAATT